MQQVVAGTLTFAFMAVILFFSTFFTLTVIAPDYADVIVNMQRERIVERGNPPADLDARLENLRSMYTPIRQSTFVVPATILAGLLYSVVIALVVRVRAPNSV